jgi:hypothetical protein
MTANVNCVANFACTLATVAGTGGTVSAGGTNSCGTTVTITATAVSSAFAAWSGGTGCSGTASHTFALNANTTCTASFNCTLSTATGAGGTVSAGTTVSCGTTVTVTATPDAGYAFSSWSGGVGCSGIASHTFALSANTTCTAAFVLNNCVVITNAGTGGTVSGGGTYICGSTQTITATANTGYTFSTWSGTGCGTTPASHTISASNTTCTASFTINSYTLTVTNGTGGGTYNYNTTPTITATIPGEMYFVSWTGTGCPATSSGTVTMTGNISCTGNTAWNTYGLTTSTAWSGTGTTSGGGTFNYNTSHTITATPAAGYSFRLWDKNSTGTGNCGTQAANPGTALVLNAVAPWPAGPLNCRANFIWNAAVRATLTYVRNSAYNYTFTWTPNPDTVCASKPGESVEYQYRLRENGVYTGYTLTTSNSFTDTGLSIYSTLAEVQARCRTTGTTGAWSATKATAAFTPN